MMDAKVTPKLTDVEVEGLNDTVVVYTDANAGENRKHADNVTKVLENEGYCATSRNIPPRILQSCETVPPGDLVSEELSWLAGYNYAICVVTKDATHRQWNSLLRRLVTSLSREKLKGILPVCVDMDVTEIDTTADVTLLHPCTIDVLRHSHWKTSLKNELKEMMLGPMELAFVIVVVVDQHITELKKKSFINRMQKTFLEFFNEESFLRTQFCTELALRGASAETWGEDYVLLKLEPSHSDSERRLREAFSSGSLAKKLQAKISVPAAHGIRHTLSLERTRGSPVYRPVGGRVETEGIVCSAVYGSSPGETFSHLRGEVKYSYSGNMAAENRQQTSQETSGSRLQVISKLITATTKNKTATAYDFYWLLHKNKRDITPMLVKDEQNLNMLHQCVLHQRLAFMEVIHVMGYWDDLIDNEIPRHSSSEYAGCNPRVMAQRARQWKLSRELDRLSEVEHSMSENSSLLKAVRASDIEQAEGVVNNPRRQVNLAAFDYNKDNCIHWACKVGCFRLLKFFKDKGADVQVKDKQENTAIHCAAMWGHHNLINFLVKQCKVDPTQRNISGRSALEMTALNGDTKSLEQMARAGVVIEPIVLILAAYAGRLTYVQQAITEYKVDVMTKDKNSKTCLMVAAEQGHKDIVKYLTQKFSFRMDEVDNRNRTIFHLLLAKGMPAAPECAKLLLDEARKQNLVPRVLNMKDSYRLDYDCYTIRGLDNGRPAWHHIHLKRQMQPYFEKASRGGTIDAGIIGDPITSGWDEQPSAEYLRACVEEHKQLNTTKDGEQDITPTAYALLKDSRDVAMLYVNAGGAIDIPDSYGLYPIHFAVMCGFKEGCDLLRRKGASLSVLDESGKTPVELARENNQYDIVSYLESDTLISKGLEFREKMMRLMEAFSRQELEGVRDDDSDVKRHMVDKGRNLQAQINIFLKDIGSGPVLEESGGNEPAMPPAHLPAETAFPPGYMMGPPNFPGISDNTVIPEENLDSTASHH